MKPVIGNNRSKKQFMKKATDNTIHTIDLNFMGIPGAIACYLIPHANGALLVECGPGSTIPTLESNLQNLGMSIEEISDVLLTHIHLDHAGAAGYLAQKGANIYVHPVGAPHMIDPKKLLSSASRIYGDMMDTLWGKFLPVPKEKIIIPEDDQVIEVEGLAFRPLDTPGHAKHHYAYIFEDVCFSGDIGGVRLSGTNHLRLPMPPPDLNLEQWRDSVRKLQNEYAQGSFSRIAPTHFGIFDDPDWHLKALERTIEDIDVWMQKVMPANPPVEAINKQFLEWTNKQSVGDGLSDETINAYEAANPSWMSAYGMQRYWRKYRSS